MPWGSSPLARGSLLLDLRDERVRGLIPAGAGLTPHSATASASAPAHPRWRGAHGITSGVKGALKGSSPLARGSLAHLGRLLDHPRLIPAGAGLTRGSGARSPATPAHPRWRGAHPVVVILLEWEAGSSPLARGSPRQDSRPGHHLGLIPAGAGLTPLPGECADPRQAHPRWRGAHGPASRTPPRSPGSSPLARGSRLVPCPSRPVLRLIPAGAGLTLPRRMRPRQAWAHPRWRGAHRLQLAVPKAGRGSSPLARGSHGPEVPQPRQGRLIPAGAGLTSESGTRVTTTPAHPRWRGAHTC